MFDDPKVIAFTTTLVTLFFTTLIKKYFDKNFLVFKLETEHKYAERKKVKDILSKNKVHLLNACEKLNHRLGGLSKEYEKDWHFVDGTYDKSGYFFRSSIYRIALVYARIELIERELVLLDTTIATKEDLEFVKFLRVFRDVLSELDLFNGIKGYSDGSEKDHIMRGSVDRMARAIILNEGRVVAADAFEDNFEQYNTKLNSICSFFDSISPDEDRYRWDRLQILHYLTISFLNAYGYDFQKTENKKFQELLQLPRECRIIGNYVHLLKRAKLENQKEIRSFIKLVD